jgi:hypothetical protein
MQHGSLVATFLGGLALGTLAGCGGDTTGGTSGGGPVPETQFVDRTVSSYCEGLRVCCQKQGMVFSAAGCDAGLRSGLTENGSICEPGTTYDAAAVGACLEQAESYIASCGSAGSSMPTVCNRMCVGNQPLGATCDSNQQCAQPASGEVICSYSTGSGQGTCMPLVHGQLGAGCRSSCRQNSCTVSSGPAGADATCYADDGLYCANDFTCQNLVAVGGACSLAWSCATGAYCAAGVCTAQKAAGAACTNYDECLGSCDGTTCVGSGANDLEVTAEICAGNFDNSTSDTGTATTSPTTGRAGAPPTSPPTSGQAGAPGT